MLEKILNRFIRNRHYWRDIGFDELSELYTSMMFRSLAVSLVGIFIPIYLYQLDYPVWQICLFYAVTFSAWTLANYPISHLIAKIGPKHTMLISYISLAFTLFLLVSQEEMRWPLAMIGVVLGISNCLFFLAFHIDFSKVKHRDHGGKELSWLISMEKTGAILGPLLGGLVGFLIGPQYIFVSAIIILFLGIVPLFITSEPTALNQKLEFNKLNVKDIRYDLVSFSFFNIENITSLIVWPLFISIYVFKENPYIQLGSIISIAVFISIFTTRMLGKTIDDKKGRTLLRASLSLNACLHIFRPFVGSYPFALGVSMANEVLTPAYKMPFFKGVYDAADDHTGKRIVYITALETVGALSRAILFTAIGIAALLFDDSKNIFTVVFIVAAIASFGIMLERFRALEGRK